MGNERVIYFDTNIFRLIIRVLSHWQKLEEFFDKEEPGLLDNSNVLFTWSQMMEACDLGRIINKIEKTVIWKQKIEGKKIIELFGFQDGLDKYFSAAVEAIRTLPDLQKDILLKSVDKAVSHTCPGAQKLVGNTLLRYRDAIASNTYMDSLAMELAWALLTSYPFIKSKDLWTKRKVCYESLMALWHRLRKEGHDLVFFRLSERQYYSYLLYSPDVDLEQAKLLYPGILTRQDMVDKIFKYLPLKQGSDLCDGEIIHFAYLGNQGLPVIGVAMGEQPKIDQRMGVFDRSLSDLQTCVTGWDLKVTLGMVFSLELDDDRTVKHAYRNLPRAACGTL